MVRPSTKGLYKGELCCRLLQTKLQVLNRKGPLLRNSHTGAAPLLHVCPSNREVSWTSQKSCMKSVEIRESLKRGADLGSVGICTASRCQRVGGVHMMHPSAKSYYAHLHWWEVSMPSHLIHTWCMRTPRFECQVISASPSCKFVTSTRRAPNTCAYVRFPEPSSYLPNEHVSDSNIRGQDPAWQVVLHMRWQKM